MIKQDNPDFRMKSPASTLTTFILQVTRQDRRYIFLMLGFACVMALDFSLKPYVLKLILNNLTGYPMAEVWSHLLWPIGFYFLLTIGMEGIYQLSHYVFEIKLTPTLRKAIGSTMMGHMLRHSHGYYQNHFTGHLANKISDLMDSIPEVIQIVVDRFFQHTIAMVIAIYALWIVHPLFAVILSFWGLFFIFASYVCLPTIDHLSDKWSERTSILVGQIVDVLSNMLAVRLFAQRIFESNRFDTLADTTKSAEEDLQWYYFFYWLFYRISFIIVQGLSLYFLVEKYKEGIITIGDFALVTTINFSVSHAFWEIAKDFSNFTTYVGKIKQALRLTTLPHDIQDTDRPNRISSAKGNIAFEHVTFFHKTDAPLFHDLSIRIEAGKNIGLVGLSGCGKTTFVNLLLRLFDVTGGSILIDGVDIRSLTQDDLHRLISFIPQDPSLFHRTLMDNIRYGRTEATEQEVIEAAKKAHAHDFIMNLQDGYQTMVGERGIKLSGGQRQRIAIARAILKDAPILILDEATSQLDSLTEQLIQESVEVLMKGKTTIAIAHRLSTLMNMDEIVVFENGKVAQRGSHEELLDQDGLFWNLWEAQTSGYMSEE